MTGWTPERRQKRSETIKSRYGENYYHRIGHLGGKKSGIVRTSGPHRKPSPLKVSKAMQLLYEANCARCGENMDEGDIFCFGQEAPYDDDKLCEECREVVTRPDYNPDNDHD